MVDFWRFIFVLLIMTHHLYHIGVQGEYTFRLSWIYVEFYYLVSGYFTMRHFSRIRNANHERHAHNAFSYTIKKFKGFLPYAVIAIMLEYGLDVIQMLKANQTFEIKSTLIHLPFELMFLSSSGISQSNLVPIWYLSGMFLVLPLLCYIIQKHHDLFSNILCWLIPLLYYGKFGVSGLREWPHDMFRAFSCMALGCFVYVCTTHLSKINWNKLQKGILTVIELTCFFVTLYITAQNIVAGSNLILLCFFIGCTIMFSQCSFTSNISFHLFNILGKISLPIYLLHWAIGTLSLHYISNISHRVYFYYSVTLVSSIILYYCVENTKKRFENK